MIDTSYTNYSSAVTNSNSASKTTKSFETMFQEETPIDAANRAKEEKKAEEDAMVEKFWADLKKSGSMLSFLQELNLEKIKDLIEEKKEDLREKYNLDDPSLSIEDRTKAIKAMNEELEAFTKDLLKDLENRAKLENREKITLADLLQSA